MLNVGLTGGIGAGKSEVSRLLVAHGAVLIDSDLIAREVVEPGTAGLAAVAAEFGPEVLRADGSLDRPRLGSIIFADPDRRRALNAIVHPLVRQRSQELVSAAAPDAVLVHDIPLLVENAMGALFDLVVVVDATEQTQLERLVGERGMALEAARARMSAQASRADRLAAADLVIDNNGSLDDLSARVHSLWDELTARATRKERRR